MCGCLARFLRPRLTRATVSSATDPQIRQALDKVNIALTQEVGLEYRMGGLQRKMLEQARATLGETLK
jgi:hypothetical protein